MRLHWLQGHREDFDKFVFWKPGAQVFDCRDDCASRALQEKQSLATFESSCLRNLSAIVSRCVVDMCFWFIAGCGA